MKKFVLPILVGVGIFTLALVLAFGVGAQSQGQAGTQLQQQNPADTAALFPLVPVPKIPVPDMPLPKSLDNLFPPKVPGPVWLLEMLELGEDFLSIPIELSENDPQNASAHFEKFKAQYEETSKLVPEWTPYFPMYPVDSLGAALKSGNQKKVNEAISNMGQVCENCHPVNMPKVQQKYHWKTMDGKTFSEINVEFFGNFSKLMQDIDFNFVAIGVDVKENKFAGTHLQNFDAGFQAMKETCKNCHTTERKYYVDANVEALISDLGNASMAEKPVNQTKVDALMQKIGEESCFKCHLVHIPAALAQVRER